MLIFSLHKYISHFQNGILLAIYLLFFPFLVLLEYRRYLCLSTSKLKVDTEGWCLLSILSLSETN